MSPRSFLVVCLAGLLATPLIGAEHFNDNDSHYTSVADDMPPANVVTITAWVMATGDGPAASDDGYIVMTDGTLSNWLIGRNTTGPVARIVRSGVTSAGGSVTLTQDVWFFIGFTRNGTAAKIYINGNTTADVNSSGTNTAVEPGTRFALGARQVTGGPASECICTIAALKVWSAVLTPEQIANEMYSYRPKTTDNMFMWIPLFTNANPAIDLTGQDNDLSTQAGSPTTADGPAIAW